ncbi:MAG: hypothetical protein ACFFDW_03035 [Candidatus Thorarchaeota archaeon]
MKHMYLLPSSKFQIKELERVLGINNSNVVQAIDYLRKQGYIKEFFTTNLLDPDGKSEITYQITELGKEKFKQASDYEIKVNAQIDSYTDSQDDIEKTKKSNRRWLIGCAIAFIILMTIMIAVILSTG